MPEWLFPALGIGVPIISVAVAWVGSAKAKEVKADLNIHVAEDKIIHETMGDSLVRIEAKLDRLIEARNEPRRSNH